MFSLFPGGCWSAEQHACRVLKIAVMPELNRRMLLSCYLSVTILLSRQGFDEEGCIVMSFFSKIYYYL